MSLDWYPWYIQNFRRKTLHLTLAQDGAYRRLIDEYMMAQGPLPADDASLARICGCSLDEWLTVADVVRPFFHQQNNKLIHKRCEQELDAQRMLTASRTAQAKEAANVRWEKHNKNKQLMRAQCASNADAMLNDATRHKKDKKGTTEVSEELKRVLTAKGWNH